jgi:hypothetical protein
MGSSGKVGTCWLCFGGEIRGNKSACGYAVCPAVRFQTYTVHRRMLDTKVLSNHVNLQWWFSSTINHYVCQMVERRVGFKGRLS